ncbi:DNA mismatch repair endonuclease MutL [Thalassospira xiamenensis]|uniref:DNA mismatch repair protein MutL n=1 Tax=Thalassospira xiamenensis TaxID=220697 RepID=A0A285TT96_9PROT|nr:DNA mismatch repair endonuclease MutL [Thalassospira xiamenensis]SOC27288.1 DNA mismatch repair protein MutL [Thalassospira xiamenensis]
MPIFYLSNAVINMIRAGEVVERPASVVKELIENSIDANATVVRISLRDGGKSLLVVEDDGDGMDCEDVDKCVDRHATSKFSGGEASSLCTYGFRGEALAAIGAVADLIVQTNQAKSAHGWETVVRFGQKFAPKPCSKVSDSGGTRVAVRSIFRKHPARHRMLRSNGHELSAVINVVKAAALAAPEVTFIVDTGSAGKSFALRAGTSGDRVQDVFGLDYVKNSAFLSLARNGMEISGRVSLPGWSGSKTSQSTIIVNNRPVSVGKSIDNALKQAFNGISKHHRPQVVLNITVPAKEVDVNAHAAKREVRFLFPDAIQSLVTDAINQAVGVAPDTGVISEIANAAAMFETIHSQKDHMRQPLGAAVGQVLGKYIVSQTATELILVDFHAAHERVVLEKMRAAARQDGLKGQSLLNPITMQFDEDGIALLATAKPELDRLGLSIKFDGDGAYVNSIPPFSQQQDARTLVSYLVETLRVNPSASPLEDIMTGVFSKFACHAAYRAGDTLSLNDMNDILRAMEQTPNGTVCNHGRPTVAAMPEGKLAKVFLRD